MSIQRKATFCPYCHSSDIIRKGTRTNQHRVIPLYLCKTCFKYFSSETVSHVKFPPRIIMKALTYYNLGYSQEAVSSILRRKHQISVPRRTISSWIHRYSKICTFGYLRDRAKKLYPPEDLLSSKELQHRQVYQFKIHNAKLDLLREHLHNPLDYTRLSSYLDSVLGDSFPHKLFFDADTQSKIENSSHRSSQLTLDLLSTVKKRKENLANDLALLGLEVATRNKERHEYI